MEKKRNKCDANDLFVRSLTDLCLYLHLTTGMRFFFVAKKRKKKKPDFIAFFDSVFFFGLFIYLYEFESITIKIKIQFSTKIRWSS